MADCNEVLRELYPFLDGEVDAHLRTHIAAHLGSCTDCLEVFDFQAELRMVVARKCSEAVPDSLRARVLRCIGDDPAETA